MWKPSGEMRFSLTFLETKRPLKEYVELSRLAEEVGFDSIKMVDHLMYKPAWPVAFAIGAGTRRVTVGPGITNPYFIHPAITAGNIACLDEITGGRAILGTGKGTFQHYLGIEAERPITAVREAILLIRHLLSGERTPFEGKVFKLLPEAFLRWEPPRKSITIFIGGKGPQALQLAGELADEVKCGGVWAKAYLPFVRENGAKGARKGGREPKEVTITLAPYTCISEDREEAKRMARLALAAYLPYLPPATELLGIDPEEVAKVSEAAKRLDFKAGARFISDKSLQCFMAYGRPGDIISRLEGLRAEGVESIDFPIPPIMDLAESIKLLGQVIAHFKGG